MKRIFAFAVILLSVLCVGMPAYAQNTLNYTNTNTASGVGGTWTGDVTISNNLPEGRDLSTTIVDGHGYRGLPIAPQMTYPGIITYLNGATDGASVTDLKTYLAYGNNWDIPTLETMSASSWLARGYKVVTVAECPKTDQQPEKMRALMKDQVNGRYKRVATITVKATNLDTTSEKLLAVASLEAASYGAPEVHVIDVGKHRVISGDGWGIGLYYHVATISSGEGSGQAGGGGTGYSTSESGYQDKPWVKVIAVIPASSK